MSQRTRKNRLLLAAAAVMSLSGCTIYEVGAIFDKGGQPYFGTTTLMILDTGILEVTSLDGKVTCKGQTTVTVRPSMYSVVGAQGTANGKCSDGRTFKVDFIQTNRTGGHGQGIDSNGKIMRAYFDRSEDVIRSQLRVLQLEQFTN